MRLLILVFCFLCSPVGWAEQRGLLGSLRESKAGFWTEGNLEVFDLPPSLHQTLSRQGLGSRWYFQNRSGQLHSARPDGVDSAVREALTVLGLFAREIRRSEWTKAFQYLAPAAQMEGLANFRSHWLRQYLSSEEADWSLTRVEPQLVEVSVFSVQGVRTDWELEIDPKPVVFHTTCVLRKQDFRWVVEAYR